MQTKDSGTTNWWRHFHYGITAIFALVSVSALGASAIRNSAGEFIATDASNADPQTPRTRVRFVDANGSGPGADWNTGLGGRSDRSGRSSQTGPSAADLLWQGGEFNAPIGVPEAPAIEGNLLISTRITAGGDSQSRGLIVAQDLSTGEELWRTQLPISSSQNWWSHSFGVRDGQVYASRSLGLSRPDYLYALDASDGSVIWRSEDLIDADIVETPPYTADGDIVVGTWRSLYRISRVDGSTVWRSPRTCPSQPGGCQATISGNRIYIWDARIQKGSLGLVVVAFDSETGAELYASAAVASSFITIEQIALFTDSTGGVYAPSARATPEDVLVALQDTGDALVESWRTPVDWVPWGSFGVGTDGSIYSYSVAHEVVQLDAATGNVLNTSMPIPFTNRFLPRLAVDNFGTLFLTAHYGPGGLFSFDADLGLRWRDTIAGAEGPALGQNGILAVTGTGTDLRAYQSSTK